MKNMFLKANLICFLLLITNLIFAQGWEKTFINDQGIAKGFDVIETQDGGYVMVGDIDLATGAIRHHVWAVKTDQDGNELWSKIYDYYNIGYRDGRGVAETLDGDLLIVGSNLSSKAAVLKISADGDSLWTKYYGGNGANAFKDIIRTAEGNFILVGEYEEEPNSDLHELWGMGMDAEGDILWSRKYFAASFSGTSAMDISPISTEDYLISGKFASQGWVVSIGGLSGNQNWQNTYQVSTDDVLFTSVVDVDNNEMILGGSSSGIAGYSPLLIETDTFGVVQSLPPFTTVNFGAITDMAATTDGGLILTGSSFDFWNQTFESSGFVTKLDSNKEIEWEIILDDSLYTEGASIQQNSDGTYLLAGNRDNGMFLKKIGDSPNAIHGIKAPDFDANIYPNPVTDKLFIEIPQTAFRQNMNIYFYDAAGKFINQYKITSSTETLDVSGFSNGFYTYLLKEGTRDLLTGKIMIQKQ